MRQLRRKLAEVTKSGGFPYDRSFKATAKSLDRAKRSIKPRIATDCGALPHERARAWRKQLVRRHRFGDDALRQRVADQILDDIAVRRDAVRERIAGDLHHPPVHLVDLARLVDLAGLERLDIATLGAGEGVE